MSKAKLDLGKFLSGGRAAKQAVDDAIAAHGRERGGTPKLELEPATSDGDLAELARVESLASLLVDALQDAGVLQRTAILGLSKALSHYCASFVNEGDVDKFLGWVGDAVRSDWRNARKGSSRS